MKVYLMYFAAKENPMVTTNPGDEIQKDIDAVGRIAIVPSLLEVICRTTRMGFAAIARVTDEKWIACSVRDEILFGLEPGGELVLETTICNEIRQHREPVLIDHVAKDEKFASHATPLMYGFQSYITVPIIRRNGSFFGTLCAIDQTPAKVNNTGTIGMFNLFAELISFHLNAIEELAFSEAKLKEEQRLAEVRDQFIAILGHDLRNPISAIMMSAELLAASKSEEQITSPSAL
ncbi:GAF domain-containing protein [Ferruginibacter sp.]|uniref:GAF domain-containing protein n=1 Tax=Ferruginibacter sp. TaxID=1940288 RepID=UPI00265B02FF|nr:GAF domain-containing protein [Ferruginibacter sp.]